MTTIEKTYECGNCHSLLPDPPTGPCDVCGSTDQIQKLNIGETIGIEMHDQINAKLKDHSLRSNDKLRVHLIAGDDQRKRDGRWMNKERLIDRDNNRYKETVTDPITGEVVHQCDEPLSDHWGHGSAKDLED